MSAKDAILRCARDLYVEHGLAGMSLRSVARCAGVSAPAIYRHFDGKEDLLWEVAAQGHALFARYLGRGLKADSPRERLRATGRGYLDFALEHPAYYTIMFVAPLDHFGMENFVSRSTEEMDATFVMLVDRVRECVDSGVLAPGDPATISMSIWAQVHGLVTLYLRLPADDPSRAHAPGPLGTEAGFRAFYQSSVDALLDGLAPR